ncbi:MAG: acyl-CoA/acyl-ACP dehydrogenase [Halioglobus sp.]|nr:acyl-CoA/acyl-ACP dehydrogenase [Halioglobus sp.]
MAIDQTYPEIRAAVASLCSQYQGGYWRKMDAAKAYPTEFVQALTSAGFLATLIPENYGGAGLPLGAGCAVLEEVHRSGGNGAACHAQMYTMGTLLRHGSEEQKEQFLPAVAEGKLRLQTFAVTEPASGTDTSRIRTNAVRDGDDYVINGQKVFISRTEHSDLMILLVRTTPREQCVKHTDGMSVLLVDMREAVGNGLSISPIDTMMNHASTELFFDDLRVPVCNLIGEEGQGFKCILDGMNAERILIAAECIGDARWFTAKSAEYARERTVFDRPIGANQGIQFPIAKAHIQTEAAALMVQQAADLYDAGRSAGAEANMAKLLASEASWAAGDTCIQTHGGYGFAAEYDVERKFRETRLYQIAPISTNLILSYVATRELQLPRSF